ncbi:MAG: hypothetical protein ACP5D2_04555 [Candidatus Nanoarchaeia archaeon]
MIIRSRISGNLLNRDILRLGKEGYIVARLYENIEKAKQVYQGGYKT